MTDAVEVELDEKWWVSAPYVGRYSRRNCKREFEGAGGRRSWMIVKVAL